MGDLHKYQLDNSSKKFICPSCSKRRFVRYIDIETKQYIPDTYGRCDREASCAYHLNPYKDGFAKGNPNSLYLKYTTPVPKAKKPIYYIPIHVLERTRSHYDQNTFIQNLLKSFPVSHIEGVISAYHLGTITKGYRQGACTFPFIDCNNNVRAIQAKQFDQNNHTTSTDFIHSIIGRHYLKNNTPIPEWLSNYNRNEKKVSCLFGDHLLNNYPRNPIALVEAPKTAIISSLYFGLPSSPKNFVWLAVYNLSSLTLDRCRSLTGRRVVLFPDLSKDGSAYRLWSEKSKAIQKLLPGTTFEVSDLLEKLANNEDREQGKDLADFLILDRKVKN